MKLDGSNKLWKKCFVSEMIMTMSSFVFKDQFGIFKGPLTHIQSCKGTMHFM